MSRLLFSKNLFFALIAVVFIVMIAGLYFQFHRVIDKTNLEINKIELNRAKALSEKITTHIKTYKAEDFSQIFENANLRKKLSNFLSLYITEEFKYIYVIYKDEKNEYRYLLDGSSGKDKGEFGQRFLPLLGKIWKQSFQSKHFVYGIQEKADGLWVTFLQPIEIEGLTKLVLVLDISTKEYDNLKRFLMPLYSFLRFFISVLTIIILLIIIQMYMFYKERKRSTIDTLTRLYNRNYLKEISGSINLNKVAIMMLDIDHFKSINDSYGHDIGDIVLSSIAKKIVNETRLEDRVIRYGGEEFLILLRWRRNRKEVMKIAERIRKNISKENLRVDNDLSLQITISIGVNTDPDECKSLEKAIKRADKMLYLAKNSGRNKVEYSSSHSDAC